MVATTFHAVFGAATGVACAAFANALRKLPAFSRAFPFRFRSRALETGVNRCLLRSLSLGSFTKMIFALTNEERTKNETRVKLTMMFVS